MTLEFTIPPNEECLSYVAQYLQNLGTGTLFLYMQGDLQYRPQGIKDNYPVQSSAEIVGTVHLDSTPPQFSVALNCKKMQIRPLEEAIAITEVECLIDLDYHGKTHYA